MLSTACHSLQDLNPATALGRLPHPHGGFVGNSFTFTNNIKRVNNIPVLNWNILLITS